MSKKLETYALVFVLLAAVYVGYSLYTGQQQSALAEQTPPSGSGSNQLPNCGDQMPVAQLVTYYLDPNNNNAYTQVSTTALVYIGGQPTPANSSTTSATVLVSTLSGNLVCGATYREIAGDAGTTYYYAKTADFKVDNSVMGPANNGKGIAVVPSGAAVLYIKNSTSNYASTSTINWSAAGKTNGSTDDTDFILKVQGPSAPNQFGDLGYAVCFRYNSGNFTDIKALGGTIVNVAHYKATASLDTIRCVEFPALAPGTYAEHSISLKAATTGPSYTTTVNTTVDISVVDKTNELYNGWLIPSENTAAGVVSNGYDLINNPNTGTGRADVSTTSLITVYNNP